MRTAENVIASYIILLIYLRLRGRKCVIHSSCVFKVTLYFLASKHVNAILPTTSLTYLVISVICITWTESSSFVAGARLSVRAQSYEYCTMFLSLEVEI